MTVFGIGQLLRRAFGPGLPPPYYFPPAPPAEALAGLGDEIGALGQLLATIPASPADAAVRLAVARARHAALQREAHGAGHELLYEYDAAEQARFEAACAREDAGEDPGC